MAETSEAVALASEAIVEASTSVDTKEEEEETKQEEYKVFVGNLAFSTSEQQLADFFNKTGKVIKANIITRGTRSLGYGFVALETEEDAKKVVDELNKQELDGRQINVEVAKPKTEGASASAPRRGRGKWISRGRGRGRGFRGRGRGRGRGGWYGNRRRYNRGGDGGGDAEANDANSAEAPATNGTSENNERPKRRGGWGYRGRGRRGRGGRGGRFGRRRPNINHQNSIIKSGEPSKTVVFVANLPFSIDDEGLKAIFKDYGVSSAHVVRRRGGRSKGFGFVELTDEEEQKKALEGLKDVESEGRVLVIKVALSDQQIQTSDDAEKAEAPAASNDEKKDEAT